MLTSYMVRCPEPGCGWFGSLLPSRDTDLWTGSVPSTSTAMFACPECGHTWRARVVGDDVVPLPEEEPVHLA
jgi:hypothetical protein